MRAWLMANLITLLARLRLSRFVVLAMAPGDTETHMRRWLIMSAVGMLIVLGMFVAAFFVR